MGVVLAVVAGLTIAEVATAVAVTGAVLGVVGAITKNKTLQTVGLVMGIAGGVVGIGASLMGAASMTLGEVTNLGTSAVSDFFSGGSAVAEAGAGVGSEAASGATSALEGAGAKGLAQEATTLGGVNDQMATALAKAPELNGTLTPFAEGGVPGTASSSTPITSPVTTSIPTPAPSLAGQSPVAEASYNTQLAGANAGPLAPSAPGTGPGTGSGGFNSGVSTGVDTGNAAARAKGMFDAMPEWMKYAAITQGIGSLGSLAGGYMQGATAQDQLEFQKLVNQQGQNQVQRLNTQNAYAPRLTFNQPAGIISR